MEGLSSGKLQLDFSELEVTRHRRRLHGSDLDRQHERDASVSPGLAPSSADGVAASGNSYHNANGGAHAVEVRLSAALAPQVLHTSRHSRTASTCAELRQGAT
jgi:hypothetical protein